MEYIENRVEALEDAVEDLREQINILADDYKIFRSEYPLYVEEDIGIKLCSYQSTEEFVRVVRCKDCEWCKARNNHYFCKTHRRFTEPDDFCSKGESKIKCKYCKLRNPIDCPLLVNGKQPNDDDYCYRWEEKTE